MLRRVNNSNLAAIRPHPSLHYVPFVEQNTGRYSIVSQDATQIDRNFKTTSETQTSHTESEYCQQTGTFWGKNQTKLLTRPR